MSNKSSVTNGLVRTYDLLESLIEDVNESFERLETEKESQHLRRATIRCVFSFIEGALSILKWEIKSELRRNDQKNQLLSGKEKEVLFEQRKISETEIRFYSVPLKKNLKKTFKIAQKVFDLNYKINKNDTGYQSFLKAKKKRNKLTHPKTYYHIRVNDEDMANTAITYKWLKSSFRQLMKSRVEKIMSTLSEEDQQILKTELKIYG